MPPIFLNGVEVIWNKRTLPSSVQKIPFLKFLNAIGKEKINFKTPPAPLREQESRDKISSYITRQFFRFLGRGGERKKEGENSMAKKPFYRQNKGRLPSDPPNYLGAVARETWRKIVPFLEPYYQSIAKC